MGWERLDLDGWDTGLVEMCIVELHRMVWLYHCWTVTNHKNVTGFPHGPTA